MKEYKILTKSHSFDDFQTMTDEERRIFYLIDDNILPYCTQAALYKKNDNTVLAYKEIRWNFRRNRFFPKTKYKTLATVTPTRVFSDNIRFAGTVLCNLLLLQTPLYINKRIFRTILKKGKVPESSYKEYIDLPDSPEEVKIFIEGDLDTIAERFSNNHELRDLYYQAQALNRKIKISWSDRKIHDIHMKWTEEINKIKCRNCSDDKIWENCIELPENVTLLNSERQIADEGLNMHHCIYANYRIPLKNKTHIAFHVNDFTAMFYFTQNGAMYSQAYYAWNKSLSEEDSVLAHSMAKYADEIAAINKT